MRVKIEKNKIKISEIDSKSRNQLLKKNISLSFIYKFISISLNFLLVPLAIHYLNNEKYGIWITLLSIMSWVTFFDIGIGNGLKNKLTEAISRGNNREAKSYVSTAYFTIITIAIFSFIIVLIVSQFVEFRKIFNTKIIEENELFCLTMVMTIFVFLNFIISLGKQLFYAYQKSSLIGLSQILSQTLSFIGIFILTKTTHGNIVALALIYGSSIIIVNLALSLYFFKMNKEIIPSIKYIDITKIKSISTLGFKFFVIQIAFIIVFTTDNMIITQVLGPEHVTPYSIVYRLFNIISVFLGILLAPLWSAYTEAYTKNDLTWIKSILKRLNKMMIPIILGTIFIGLSSNFIIKIWIRKEILIPKYLVLFMGVYVIISAWGTIYSNFVNGIGKINVQMYVAIIASAINIPLSIYFAKYLNLGSPGVILGTIVSSLIPAIIIPIQSFNLLKKFKNNKG